VRFQVLTAASMKFRDFWDVVTLKFTDVSEVHTASIIRVWLQRDYTALHPRTSRLLRINYYLSLTQIENEIRNLGGSAEDDGMVLL